MLINRAVVIYNTMNLKALDFSVKNSFIGAHNQRKPKILTS